MRSGMRHLLLVAMMVLTTVCFAATAPPGVFSKELDTDAYDCQLALKPAATLSPTAKLTIWLEWNNAGNSLELAVTRENLSITSCHDGRRTPVASLAAKVIPGTPCHLTFLRRGPRLELLRNTESLYHGTVPRGGGALATLAHDAGWEVVDAHIQRIEPVVFADDFMRAEGEKGPWQVASGHWALKSVWDKLCTERDKVFSISAFAQNPFAWVGTSESGQSAACMAGAPFWEDYTFTAAICPGQHGAAGLLFNLADAKNGLLLRWTPANSQLKDGNRLTLYRLTDGVRTELAHDAGGYVPGQWYRVSVISTRGGIRVLIDGQQRCKLPTVAPWRGGVGLYAEGKDGITFDDITVYGHMLDTDLLQEMQQTRVNQRFRDDSGGMRVWSSNLSDWVNDWRCPGLRWYRTDLFGEHTWMTVTFTPRMNVLGELWLSLNGDGDNPATGYRAAIKMTGNKVSYALYHDTAVLTTAEGNALTPQEAYTARFSRSGNAIRLEIDGATVAEARDVPPVVGWRPALQTVGLAVSIRDAQAFSHNRYDYTFADAPVDWRTEGTWAPDVRWSCTPTWSFLCGWDSGDAVLWHKQRFTGDQSIQAFMAVKMDYPRERRNYFNRLGNFAVTLCGDGSNPRSGYAGIYGAPDENGTPYAQAVLLRNGAVVASTPIRPRYWGSNHHCWFILQLDKRGNTVSFHVKVDGERYNLDYPDTEPIAGGIPAIWTFDNGMCLARARFDFAHPPQPRHDPPVVLAAPWFPEWVNKGRPLILDFNGSWSASGKPVTLVVQPDGVPAGEGAADVDGNRVTLTPRKTGPHCYAVYATDGQWKSPHYNVHFQVFDASPGRNDAHALLLYRFDEGQGHIVHDRSSILPPADLYFPADRQGIQWLPGGGIALHTLSPLETKTPLTKLLALRKTQACTIECWFSPESMFAPPEKSACFFTWEPEDAGIPNLGVGNYREYMMFTAGKTNLERDNPQTTFPWGYTSLHHLVITWDGSTTTSYIDGEKIATRKIPWTPEQWKAEYPLLLGNQQAGNRPFPGNVYLLAIYGRCFSPADIHRHYAAGPSAR